MAPEVAKRRGLTMLNGTAAPEDGGGGGAEKIEEALEAGGGGGGGGAESVESERLVESKSSDADSGVLVVALGLFAQGALKVFEDISIFPKKEKGKEEKRLGC